MKTKKEEIQNRKDKEKPENQRNRNIAESQKEKERANEKISTTSAECADTKQASKERNKEQEQKQKHGKQNEKKPKKYSRVGSILWATKNLWRIDQNFVFFIFASVVPAVLLPLVEAYFPKVLLDRIGEGKSFSRMVGIMGGFLLAITLLRIFKKFLESRCSARIYYFASVYQAAMGNFQNYEMDFETTEKQDFKKISGYAWEDATAGRCLQGS